jgi:hypothetical protein
MKNAVFWDVTPCGHSSVLCFRYCSCSISKYLFVLMPLFLTMRGGVLSTLLPTLGRVWYPGENGPFWCGIMETDYEFN